MKNDQPSGDAGNGAASPSEANRVDQIRDILFGSQMRDYDNKFSQLEDRLKKSVLELGDDVKKQLASLEAFVKAELASIGDQMQTEKEERNHAVKTALDSLNDERGKVRKYQQQNEEALGDLRSQLVSEAKQLTEKIRKGTADLNAAVKRESDSLRGDFTTRKDLAELFAQFALQLRGDESVKSKK